MTAKFAIGSLKLTVCWQTPVTPAMEVLIEDAGGQTNVFLATDGDHIAIRYLVDNAGYEREITLPPDSFAYDRAVRRARIGAAFL